MNKKYRLRLGYFKPKQILINTWNTKTEKPASKLNYQKMNLYWVNFNFSKNSLVFRFNLSKVLQIFSVFHINFLGNRLHNLLPIPNKLQTKLIVNSDNVKELYYHCILRSIYKSRSKNIFFDILWLEKRNTKAGNFFCFGKLVRKLSTTIILKFCETVLFPWQIGDCPSVDFSWNSV